jgi:two-component system response regulator NreC
MSAAIRILLAEDQAMVRAGLAAILGRETDFRVVAEAGTGGEALALALRLEPDVAVIDVDLRDMDGLEVLDRLRARGLPVRVLMLSASHHGSYLRRALQAGAAGYLPKRLGATDLVRAVRVAARGGSVFAAEGDGADLGLEYVQLALLAPRHSSLTEREREVLHMVALGYSNTDIGSQLHISPKTVDSHRTHLMDKLGLHSRADLTRYALHHGYLVAS